MYNINKLISNIDLLESHIINETKMIEMGVRCIMKVGDGIYNVGKRHNMTKIEISTMKAGEDMMKVGEGTMKEGMSCIMKIGVIVIV
jgi:hypothetical protein